jgi:O-antigen ligase
MSLSLLAFLLLFAGLTFGALYRPIFGVALYMLTYFGDPTCWWWGDPLESFRLNLFSAVVSIASVLIHSPPQFRNLSEAWLEIILGLIVVNDTFVHFGLAEHPEVSLKAYDLAVKIAILTFLIRHSIQTKADFLIFMAVLAVAVGHIGYEVKFNGAGGMYKGRLEGVGPPTANSSNQLASLLVTVLPIVGTLALAAKGLQRWIAIFAAPFAVNTLLLCNSRGAYLAAICSAVVFLVLAPPKLRRTALLVVGGGGLALLMLARDDKFVERFMTTFVAPEERDASATGRLDYWKAGLRMVQDYPLGAGGDGFKRVHGQKYRAGTGHDEDVRSVHNGFINEACEWGVQGLILRGSLYFYAALKAFLLSRRIGRTGDANMGLVASSIVGGLAAFLATCTFGDNFDNEWGMWLVALSASFESLALRGKIGGSATGYTWYRLVPASQFTAGQRSPAQVASI